VKSDNASLDKDNITEEDEEDQNGSSKIKSAGKNNSDNEDLENDDDIYENDGNGQS
jgi:hypothetical protein